MPDSPVQGRGIVGLDVVPFVCQKPTPSQLALDLSLSLHLDDPCQLEIHHWLSVACIHAESRHICSASQEAWLRDAYPGRQRKRSSTDALRLHHADPADPDIAARPTS